MKRSWRRRMGMEREMDKPAELPLTASPCVEFPISDAQTELLAPLLALQRCHDRSVIFMMPAQSYDPAVRKGWLRLQFKVVPRKAAVKALKILREAGIE